MKVAKARKDALQRMCIGPDGKLTRDARIIVAYLNRQCNGDGTNSFPVSQVTGQIDHVAMARMAGRREVYDMLVRAMSLKLTERHNPEE